MKCLSIQQPWLELILRGMKTVENRTWEVPYRGWILLHAPKKVDTAGLRFCRQHRLDVNMGQLAYGGFAGVGNLIGIDKDILTELDAAGQFHWRFAYVMRLPQVVVHPGQRGLWFVSLNGIDILDETMEKLKAWVLDHSDKLLTQSESEIVNAGPGLQRQEQEDLPQVERPRYWE